MSDTTISQDTQSSPSWETADGSKVDAIAFLRSICHAMRSQDNRATSYPLYLVKERINGFTHGKVVTAFLTQDGADAYIANNSAGLKAPYVYVDSMHDNEEMSKLMSSLLRIESAVTEMIASRIEQQHADMRPGDLTMMVRRMDQQRRIKEILLLPERSQGDCHRVAAFFCDAGIPTHYAGQVQHGVSEDRWHVSVRDRDEAWLNAEGMIAGLPIDIDFLDNHADSCAEYASMTA